MERRYGYGVGLVVIGGAFLSLSGIMLRNIESANGWQILFYRGLAFSVMLFVILLLKYRGATLDAFRAIGRPGIGVALALGLGSVCYIFAILLTTVANAVFIIGASPLATAFVAWVVLGEKTSRFGVMAMLLSLTGIGLMFADGLIEGRWLGNVAALLVVCSFVIFLLVVRGRQQVDMLPATCLGGLVMAAVGGLVADDLIISRHDLIISLLMGWLQFGIGFLCFTIAARYILASEVALFALTEAILGPIWVWIWVAERPSQLTMIGSGIVLLCVVSYCLVGIRDERRRIRRAAILRADV